MPFRSWVMIAAAVLALMLGARRSWVGAELVAQWTFNEPDGDVATDTSASRHDAKLVNAPQRATEGNRRFLQLRQDQQQYADAGVAKHLNLTSSFSILAWVRLPEKTEPSRYRGEAGIGKLGVDGDHFDYGLTFYQGPAVLGYVANGGNSVTSEGAGAGNGQRTHDDRFVRGRWTCIVFTFDGTNAYEPNMKLFIDGQLVDQKISKVNPPGHTDMPFLIGARTVASSYLEADLDEVRVYSHPLSSEEVVAVFKEGSQSPPK